MKVKALVKPKNSHTRSLKLVALYEELMGTHEPLSSGCKSKCPDKCSSCR